MSVARLSMAACLLLAVACAPSGQGMDGAQADVVRGEVQEALSGLVQAMNSHDPDQIFRYYRGDGEFLYLGCTDVLLTWNAYSGRVATYYRANPEVTFQQEVIQIQVLSPTVAVAALRGGSSEAEDLFWTEVLVKEAGEWKVTYEHESWPGCSPAPAPHPFTTPESMSGEVPLESDSAAQDSTAPDSPGGGQEGPGGSPG